MLRCRIVILHCTIGLIGCEIGDITVFRDGGGPAEPRNATGDRPPLDHGDDVLTFLDGRALVMEAGAVPTHPNGFDRDVDYGQATQCIHRVTMEVLGGAFRVTTDMATLRGAAMTGDVGTCEPAAPNGAQFQFDTTAVLVENVRDDGHCFDITLTYAGFGQEGRGEIAADGSELLLELFFRDQAVGHRCADGDVGAPTVTLNQEPFSDDAVQIYRIEG